MELIRQRGNLRFSTLMVFFHISSVEAIAIVEKYQKKGILDAKGKYVPEGESGATVRKKKEGLEAVESEYAEIAGEMFTSKKLLLTEKLSSDIKIDGQIKKARQKENRKLHDDVVTGQQGKKEVPEKAGKIPIKKEKETLQKAKNKPEEILPSKRKEQPKKKSKSKKLIQRNFMKPTASDVEGQISLFDYMQFGG